MRVSLVAGNWKMNGNRATARALAQAVVDGLPREAVAEMALCPPFVHLATVADVVAHTPVRLGAQNLSEQQEGAFTGETSGGMLADLGCHYVIVGHSERRRIYGETEALVAEKFAAARGVGLVPIVCVGETREQRQADATRSVVARQLDAVFDLNPNTDLGEVVIAYEPVWAIGTGDTASPEQAQEVHAFIRELVGGRDRGAAPRIRLLYGGSVTADNAPGLFGQDDIDGALVGGASLKAEQFLEIYRAANG